MKIDDAIKALTDIKNRGVKNIIFAHWECDLFDKEDNKEWEDICECIDAHMDWSNTFDAIMATISVRNSGTAEGIYSRNYSVLNSFINTPEYKTNKATPELIDNIVKAMMEKEKIEELAQAVETTLREQIIRDLS